MRFVDRAEITIRSGHGGNGCVSFRREKFIPKGGPDGGDGGKGGNVYFRANPSLLTLYDLRLQRHYRAPNGQPGQGKQKYGRKGEDLYIDVPVGTLVYQLLEDPQQQEDEEDTPDLNRTGTGEGVLVTGQGGAMYYEVTEDPDEESEPGDYVNDHTDDGQDGEQQAAPEEDRWELVADIVRPDQVELIAKGGRGGKGNTHFKSATMRTPRFAQPGEPAEEKRLRLELKILADGGLVGLPNAGKSTLLSAISAAKPKIAPYPFTTTSPNLGVVINDFGDHLVLADIPGLIEGAHQGRGLGMRFLRHVERNRFLVHMASAEELYEDDPWSLFQLVQEEMNAYSPLLAQKPQILVVNKIDLLSEEALQSLRTRTAEAAFPVFFISALTGAGLDALVAALWNLHEQTREQDSNTDESK